jgi:hypothetical protein
VLVTVAGTYGQPGATDGQGSIAGFRDLGLLKAIGGDVYAADTGASTVRLIAY